MKNTVHLIDCMEHMAKVPDKYYELAIVDPPYGIDIEGIWGDEKNGYKTYKKGGWDSNPPTSKYFDELFRISQNQIIWGGNYFTKNLPSSMGWILWDKGQRAFTCSDGELAFTSFNKALRIYEYSRSLSNFKDIKIHICQKPVALYKWLLTNYAKPHDKIFDSHVGSGSSRIACHDLGFDFEGCELDPDYWQGQEDRFKAHISQQSLFDTSEIQELIYK